MKHSGFDFAHLKDAEKSIGYDVDAQGKHTP